MKLKATISFEKKANAINEAEVETHAVDLLKKSGYRVTQRRCINKLLNDHWPSKNNAGSKSKGYPDLLLYEDKSDHLLCVWENKTLGESAEVALTEARFYIEGLRKALPNQGGLPRIAVGYNGSELRVSVFGNDARWYPLTANGTVLANSFIVPSLLTLGINAVGHLTAPDGIASATDLRAILPGLKTLYRTIPKLSSGRAPIDFTVALLTLKLVLETNPDWGFWSEQPRFTGGAKSTDHAIAERFNQLVGRILSDFSLKLKYGDIFSFKESSEDSDETFNFIKIIDSIEKGRKHFEKMFSLIDNLPPLHGADFDIFGEVYQALGDEVTKKKLGEFFTGRHIIAGVLPILFERARLNASFAVTSKKKMGDIACGTGGFLTEMLRLAKSNFKLKDSQISSFAKKAFYGYDLSSSNASRARVNMYFAGDGFSEIKGGIDSLAKGVISSRNFDVIATNPPYGQYHDGRIEEAFLQKTIDLLKPGVGWGCIVLPTGTIENPRSEKVRFNLLRNAKITDVIALPKHAFAPYTQQRTAVVVFVKRSKPIAAETGDWKSLLSQAGEEVINFFVVDNDGFANSDKRYRTDRVDEKTGIWLHDDLSIWQNKKALSQPSKLYAALVHGVAPSKSVDEMGKPLPTKFGKFKLSKIYKDLRARGVPLLPDVLLRGTSKVEPVDSWVADVNRVKASVTGLKVSERATRETVDGLLATELEITSSKQSAGRLADMFHISKGNQHLTELAIYQFVVDTGGVPVFGGGSKGPRFNVNLGLIRENGEPATLFTGPALVVAMDGSSGSVQVIESGKFYCNHHGAVLEPTTKNVNLWCIAQLIEARLRGMASNQGSSATLTMPQLTELVIPNVSSVIGKKIEQGRKTLTVLAKLLT